MSGVIPPQAQFTQDETLGILADRARENDQFTCKVYKKKLNPGALQFEHIASFAEVRLQHLQNPETWLPAFAGGGTYQLAVYPPDPKSSARIGGLISWSSALNMPPHEAKVGILNSANWQGPGVLVFPAIDTPMAATPFTPAQTQGQPMPLGYVPPLPPLPVAGLPPGFAEMEAAMRRREVEFAEREARQAKIFAEERATLERANLEAKMRSEFEAKNREIEMKLAALAATPKTEGPDKTVAMIAALAPMAGALLTFFQNSQAKNAELAQQAATRNDEFIKTMLANQGKPAQIDPAVTMLMEMVKSSAGGQAEMMMNMVNVMQTVSKNSMGMIEAVADIQLGSAPQDHPVLSAIREGVKAIGMLSAGTARSAAKAVTQTQQQQTLAAGQVQQVAVAQQVAAQAQVAAQQQAAKPAPQTIVSPPAGSPDPRPNVPAAFDGPPTATPPAQVTQFPAPAHAVPVVSPVITLQNRIKNLDPVEDLAKFFLDSMETPQMIEALAECDNNPLRLLGEVLGAEWIEANEAYLDSLIDEVQRQGLARGMVAAEGDEGDEGEDAEAQS